MKTRIIILICIVFALGSIESHAQYSIAKSVFGSGCTEIADNSHTIYSTIGQSGVTRINNDNYDVHSGFWFMGGLPDIVMSEGFENNAGSLPSGWSFERNSGPVDWIDYNGSSAGIPSSAYSGDYNSLFYHASTAGYSSKLVTAAIDFGTNTTNPQLKFWHCMAVSAGNQDELRVYYKTSLGGSWVLLQTYTASVSSWTQRTIDLPNANSTYYLAFEGLADDGYGVCIDEVTVLGESPTCYTDLYIENVTYASTDRKTFRASNNIVISNSGGGFQLNTSGGNGARIALTAGSSILLKPGFIANSGAKFHAVIAGNPCEIFIDLDKVRRDDPGIEDLQTPIFSSAEIDLKLYPNPTSGIFTLELNNYGKITNLKISDIYGRLIYKQAGLKSGDHQINLSAKVDGMYIISVASEGNIATGRIIKQAK